MCLMIQNYWLENKPALLQQMKRKKIARNKIANLLFSIQEPDWLLKEKGISPFFTHQPYTMTSFQNLEVVFIFFFSLKLSSVWPAQEKNKQTKLPIYGKFFLLSYLSLKKICIFIMSKNIFCRVFSYFLFFLQFKIAIYVSLMEINK